MLQMDVQGRVLDEDIIKEDEDELVKVTVEDLIHEALKGGWVFEVAMMSGEGGFIDVWGMDSDLMVPSSKVKLDKDCRAM